MRYRLAIFDMDGTILNTLTDIADSVNATLEGMGMPTRTLEEVCRFVGNGIHKLIERAVPPNSSPETVEKTFDAFRVYYMAHCAEKTAPYEGISEMLAHLREAGYLLAVLSNKADAPVKALAERYFTGAFDLVLGQREGVPTKPAPDGVFDVLRTLGVAAADAVYIGDSEVDVATAQNAGLDGIFVTYGFRTEQVLRDAGGTEIYHTVAALEQALLG